MYSRKEIIRPINGNFVSYMDSLSEEQKLQFLSIIKTIFLPVALSYIWKPDADSLTITSSWGDKESYILVTNQVNELTNSLFGISPDEYYNDANKFTIEIIEEII